MKSTQLTKEYYNGIARGYKELYHQEQIEKIKEVLYYIQKLPQNNSISSINPIRVLDLGSGDGVLNQFIPKYHELYSFDLSAELLQLNSNSENRKYCGSCESLDFEDNYFDAIYLFSVIQDVKDINKAFLEIQRVITLKGICIISFVRWGSRVNELKEKVLEIALEVLFEKELEKDYIFVIRVKK